MIHRASGLGGCLKGQIAACLGMKPIEPDEASFTRMAEGQLHEDDVVARLRTDGYEVTRQQELVTIHSTDTYLARFAGIEQFAYKWMVQGHLDGVLTGDPFTPTGPKVLEIKSMGKDAFRLFKAQGWEAPGLVQKYKWQLSVYMLATGLEALLIAKSRDSGELLRMPVEMPFYDLTDVTARVAYIEDHVARGQLPDDCPHDFFCPFKYLCTQAPADDVPDDLTPAPSTVVRYWELGQQIKALETERKALELPVGSWSDYKATKVVRDTPERVVKASRSEYVKVTRVEKP